MQHLHPSSAQLRAAFAFVKSHPFPLVSEAAAAITAATGNFYLGLLLAIPLTFASGYLLEFLIIRHL